MTEDTNGSVSLRVYDKNKNEVEFLIPRKQAEYSRLIMSMLEDDDDEAPEIPLMGSNVETLTLVIQFFNLLDEVGGGWDAIQTPIRSNDMNAVLMAWQTPGKPVHLYADFINRFSLDELVNLLREANYLDIPSLLDLCLSKTAALMYGKSVEETKDLLGIKGDISLEEAKRIREQNSWLFKLPDETN